MRGSAGTRARRTLLNVCTALGLVALTALASPPAGASGWSQTVVPNSWSGVAYGEVGGVPTFVAVASAGTDRVATSTDGATWTRRPATDDSANWLDVTFGNGLFVAVAGCCLGAPNLVMTSPDGITWTPRAVPALNWRTVAFGTTDVGDPLFVAFANTAPDGAANNRVMTSPDGITWTLRSSSAPSSWSTVAFGTPADTPRWVALADGDADRIAHSPNGTDWASPASINRSWTSIAYGTSGFVGVSSSGTAAALTSTDGLTYSSNTGLPDQDWGAIAYGEPAGSPLYVAVAESGAQRAATTTDGITWTLESTADDSVDLYAITYGAGVFVAVGEGHIMVRGTVAGSTLTPPTDVLAPTIDVTCEPLPLVAGAQVTCTVTGGAPDFDILWRAAVNPVVATDAVTLDADGTGTFTFTVPASAVGSELTVELVDWAAPVSLGVVGGPVPAAVPGGEGSARPELLVAFLLVAVGMFGVAAVREVTAARC